MQSTQTIVDHHGQLCVEAREPHTDRPIIEIHRYPLGMKTSRGAHLLGIMVVYEGEGIYREQGVDRWRPLRFRLEHGGNTRCILPIEEEPIPRPKTRVETRWHAGRWEKYLKASGWVLA